MPEPSSRGDAAISADMFNHTRWSLVAAVRDGGPGSGRSPLEELSESYWFPVYACIRHHGHPPAAAYHLAGCFFAWLAQQIRQDSPTGFGRFRVFLFDRLQRFLAETTADEGGSAPVQELELLEQRLSRELAGGARPDSAFERSFGLQVMARSRERLAEETRRSGRSDMYQRLAPYLTAEPAAAAVPVLAAELGIGMLAVQVAIKRLRQRFRELVESELAETVTNSAELDAERAALLRALSGTP
jgi:RNA polymerase sigma-70 factor (ECF subfamily)